MEGRKKIVFVRSSDGFLESWIRQVQQNKKRRKEKKEDDRLMFHVGLQRPRQSHRSKCWKSPKFKGAIIRAIIIFPPWVSFIIFKSA